MLDLDQEIEQTAEIMEKSVRDPKEVLFDTIVELGPEEIRARLPMLEKSEQETLLAVLEEMKKGGVGSGVKGHLTPKQLAAKKQSPGQAEDKHPMSKILAAVAEHGGGYGAHGHRHRESGARDKHGVTDADKQMHEAMKRHGLSDHEMALFYDSKHGRHAMDSLSMDQMHHVDSSITDFKHELPDWDEAHSKRIKQAMNPKVKKALEMDKDYAAKYVQGKITDTKIQEDKADDDQDEKLVKEGKEAESINHQGSKTDGIEGQVIKGKESMKKEEVKQIADKEADKEVKEHEVEMHGKKGVKKCMKKSEAPFKKVKSGKKEEMVEGLKEIKKSIEEQLKEFGVEATPALVKSEMKRLLAEESQNGDAPSMDEKTTASKENVAALNLAADSKEAQSKVNDEKQGQMKKSVPWGSENDLLKARTFGRNHTFSLEEYLTEVSKEPTEEVVAKSQKAEDLNDIIAKGQDTTWGQIETQTLLKSNVAKQRGQLVKSFADNEIAQALGLSEEEAKKILGE